MVCNFLWPEIGVSSLLKKCITLTLKPSSRDLQENIYIINTRKCIDQWNVSSDRSLPVFFETTRRGQKHLPVLTQDPRSHLSVGEGLGEFRGARIPVGEQAIWQCRKVDINHKITIGQVPVPNKTMQSLIAQILKNHFIRRLVKFNLRSDWPTSLPSRNALKSTRPSPTPRP